MKTETGRKGNEQKLTCKAVLDCFFFSGFLYIDLFKGKKRKAPQHRKTTEREQSRTASTQKDEVGLWPPVQPGVMSSHPPSPGKTQCLFVCLFHLFRSRLYSQHLDQCLAHSRASVNTGRVNE